MKTEAGPELDALMARLAEGDRSAFTPAFRLLWEPVRHLCFSLLKHEQDAADAAQEAMQKILERAGEYDRSRSAIPWALTIASWECRTIARKRHRRRESQGVDAEARVTAHPEEEHVRRNLAVSALAALEELSESDREALVATFWGDEASVTGATLRKRRERALKRLRDIFGRMYGTH